MDLVIILLLLVVAFILCLTFIPANINFQLEKRESLTRRVTSIVWGAVGIAYTDWDKTSETRYLLFGQTIIRRRKEKKTKERPKIEKGQIVKRARALKSMRLLCEAMPHFIDFIKTLAKRTSIRKVHCIVQLGLSSPANTGILFGYFTALRSVLRPMERLRIRLTPVFDKQTLEGGFNVILRIKYPIRIIAAAIGLFFKKPVRGFMKSMREFR